MIDTSTLSGYLLDYYCALAENMPNPRLRKHEREDTYICCIGDERNTLPKAYSPTTNPALALPIIGKLFNSYNVIFNHDENDKFIALYKIGNENNKCIYCGKIYPSLIETCIVTLVDLKFPDGLPEPIYESEK